MTITNEELGRRLRELPITTPDPGAVLPPAWHSVQAWVVGRWLAGLPPVTPVVNDVVELWQLAHSPLGGWLASCAVVGRVTIVTPVKLLPSSWQLEQAVLATALWLILPPVKVLVPVWQLSHEAVVGM